MHETAKRLFEAAQSRGIDAPSDIARSMNISQQTLKNWEERGVSKDGFLKAQSAFNINANWIETGKGNKATNNGLLNVLNHPDLAENSLKTITTLRRVPLISLVAAGNWSESVDNFQTGDAEQWIATTVTVKRHTYALRVEGDSMEPKFPHGAIIIVEPEDEPRNGSYVIVRQNGSDATFKQLVIDGGNTYLKPLNDRYPIMQMREDAVICGVVKQMVMDV